MSTCRIKKRFFSSIKECAWLNELGEKGFLLVSRKENSYTFEQTDKQLYYCVEWLDCSAKSEQAEEYISSLAEQGITLAATYSLWAYFVSETCIPESETAKKRTAIHYRNIAILLYSADAVVSIFIAYHLAIRGFLEKQYLFFEAPTREASSNLIINLCRRLFYGAELLLYRYEQLCANLFGETKATLALGILIPLAIALSVVGAFWLAEWQKNRSTKEKMREERCDAYQESETSGKIESGC